MTKHITYFLIMDKDELRKRFGANVRKHRDAQGLSQRKFAAMIDTNQSYLWEIETGQTNVGFDLICKIAEALELSVADLIDF